MKVRHSVFLQVISAALMVAACGGRDQRSEEKHDQDYNEMLLASGIDPATNVEFEAGETRNGGYGVLVNGRLVSLDLAMRNVHEQPYLSLDTPFRLSTEEQEAINYHLTGIAANEVINVVAAKLAELRGRLNEVGVYFPVGFLMDTMADYTWVQHGHLACLDVRDDDNPYPDKKQVAYRYQNTIRFCKDFAYLDSGNQAAVIMHEIIYAALAKKSVLIEMVGYLFSPGYKTFSLPAKTELKRLGADLNVHLVNPASWVQVLETGSIDSRLLSTWTLPAGERACFGRGQNQTGSVWVLWKTNSQCEIGELKLGPFAHSFAGSGTLLMSNEHEVGTTVGSQLMQLCSGDYTGICQFETMTTMWRFLVSQPGISLHAAAAAGNLVRVQYLLSAGTPVDLRDDKGSTALIVAAKNGQAEVADFLLASGAAIDARDNTNKSALFYAFEGKKYGVVKYLAVRGADVNSDGLLVAAVNGPASYGPCDAAMVKALLHSPTIDTNYLDPLKTLIEKGDVACSLQLIESYERTGLNLLHMPYLALAAGHRNTRVVEVLVQYPIDPNLRAHVYQSLAMSTAVCHAVKRGDMVILQKILMRDDIEVDDPSLCGESVTATPLHIAIQIGFQPGFDALLKYGSSLKTFSYFSGFDYIQPLAAAAAFGRTDMAKVLIAAGAPLNKPTDAHSKARGPLFFAIQARQLEIVKALISAGSDVNAEKSLCEARKFGFPEIVSYIEANGGTCEPG
jgi:ankyrin repeat protein